MVQWLRLCTTKAGDQGSILGQGTRSYMLQLKILYAKTKGFHIVQQKSKIPCAITETWHSQINFLRRYIYTHTHIQTHIYTKVETVADFILGGSKIAVDGDCSHEIKRCLLLERKVMTNLDSILTSRHITLPTKVCRVKAMVFPVVMYGYVSWTIKKAEH